MPETPPDMVARLKITEKTEPIASFLDMRLVELAPGFARVAMKMKPEYLNFNGFVFGGIIMSLADQAFAYASNSVSPSSVSIQFNIHFLNGPRPDDELIAEAHVLKNGRRAGTTEMNVTDSSGKLIARATGITIPIG